MKYGQWVVENLFFKVIKINKLESSIDFFIFNLLYSSILIPSIDGGIVILSPNSRDFKKLPLRAKDIVASSPFYSEDGSIYVGSKITTLYAVNPINGEVYKNYTLDSVYIYII